MVQIHGKEYMEVNERLRIFRDKYKDWSLVTNIAKLENGLVVMCASISNDKGRLIATGYAYEKEGSTQINKTSYIENCETSAWGRALANLGIGIDGAVASADEVSQAKEQQSHPEQKDSQKKQSPNPTPTSPAETPKGTMWNHFKNVCKEQNVHPDHLQDKELIQLTIKEMCDSKQAADIALETETDMPVPQMDAKDERWNILTKMLASCNIKDIMGGAAAKAGQMAIARELLK